MSDNVELKSFPKDAIEAAAYLYIQHQDLTGKSPSEIYELYLTAYYDVLKSHRCWALCFSYVLLFRLSLFYKAVLLARNF